MVGASMNGRIALVTGGASGLGLATGQLLAERGCRVLLADSNEEQLAAVVAKFSSERLTVQGIVLDVQDRAMCATQVAHIADRHGQISIVVNSAGVIGKSKMGDENSAAGWDRVIGVNLTGSYNVIAATLDHLKAVGNGSIINISSVVGLRSGFGEVSYATSKGGVLALTRQLCRELAEFGIRVNCVAPGYIDNSMNLGDMQPWMEIHTPMKRLGQPHEIAEAIAFLASDSASYINGVVLPVDGGYLVI